jgi:hypothetical protein
MNGQDKYMIAFGVLITAVFISRQIASSGVKKLDADKKARLLEMGSSNQLLHYLFLVVLVFGFYGLIRLTSLDTQLALMAYFLLLLGYVIFNSITSYRKLKANDFPESYIKSHLLASIVRLIGIFLFFGVMVLDV